MRQVGEARRGSGPGRERGQVLILFVLMLAVLLGFVALTIDVGLFFTERRQLQNAADAAALAGASALPNNPSLARQLAGQWASNNGFSSELVTVNTPYEGNPAKIEVIINDESPAVFARVLGFTSFDVSARAVAGVQIDAAFLVLDPTACKAFEKSGSGSLIIQGMGGIMVNSSCSPDALYQGGSGNVEAAAILYYEEGGYRKIGSGQLIPDPVPASEPIPDPLADLSPPALEPTSPDSGGTPDNPSTQKLLSGDHTLRPGVYYGGIEVSASANVTFQAGTYVMAGGGFKLVGSGTVTGDGIFIYNTYDPQKNSGDGACGGIQMTGNGRFTLSAPTQGLYEGIIFWQDKACTNDIKLSGNNTTISGVIYAPTAKLILTGSGSNVAFGSIQVIVGQAYVSGAGNMTIDFTPFLPIPLKPRLTE